MRIVVTGAGGRLGRAVVDRAANDGDEVIALDLTTPDGLPAAVDARACDLTDHDATTAAFDGADAVIHLAALISPKAAPEPVVHDNNVLTNYHALLAATQCGIERVCIASSVNAIGGVWGERARFDYFPLDESHPAYPEDGYSLSKWIGEQQAAAIARRVPKLSVGCLRLHGLVDEAPAPRPSTEGGRLVQDLWGYTPIPMAVDACLAVVRRPRPGCEVYYVVADRTWNDVPSRELAALHYPSVPLRDAFGGHDAFYDSGKLRSLFAEQ